MKLSKILLGAILIGITIQATSCSNDDPKPNNEKEKNASGEEVPIDCPACGMG